MMRRLPVLGLGIALGLGSAFAPAADDTPTQKPTEKTAPAPAPAVALKAPDWTKYTTVGDVFGEVVKADDKSVTIRVTWDVTASGGGKGRPRLSGNHRNFHNPFTM